MKAIGSGARKGALAGGMPLAMLLATPVAAADDTTLLLDLRWRHEQVSAEGPPDDASVSTLRMRLGAAHAFNERWSGLIEFEDVREAGMSDYNDTVNGDTRHPVVADPEDTELNRLQLDWKDGAGNATLGRQRINLGSQRFIGAVGFRQNEQTFDAARAVLTPADSTIEMLYLARANRIFGAHHPVNANTALDGIVVDYGKVFGDLTIGVFGHGFDFTDQPDLSHRNLGIRADWTPGDWMVQAEFAQQDDHGDAVRTGSADYRRLGFGRRHDGFRWAIAQEVLGSNGVESFQTPFATLHKFNGWADVFLATPPAGLDDRWLELGGSLAGFDVELRWHDFAGDSGGASYGDELDLAVHRKFDNDLKLSLEYATFSGEAGFADVDKIWLTITWAFEGR